MIVIKTQKEFNSYIKNGVASFDCDVDIKCSISTLKDIKAGDIKARNIKAGNIDAWDINAGNIKAGNISFHAVAFACKSFQCKSISGRRENSKHFCLDSEVVIKGA